MPRILHRELRYPTTTPIQQVLQDVTYLCTGTYALIYFKQVQLVVSNESVSIADCATWLSNIWRRSPFNFFKVWISFF
jgi:hypothetical protein